MVDLPADAEAGTAGRVPDALEPGAVPGTARLVHHPAACRPIAGAAAQPVGLVGGPAGRGAVVPGALLQPAAVAVVVLAAAQPHGRVGPGACPRPRLLSL